MILIQVEFIKVSDRLIYTERDELGILIGLNYSQGDNMDDFKENFMKNDSKLLAYYNEFEQDTDIDDAIWNFVNLEEFFMTHNKVNDTRA